MKGQDMPPFRLFRAVAALAPAAVLALAAPAQAAVVTGWNVVLSQHYGKASNSSGYSALATVAPNDVWAFGSTNVAGFPAPGTPVAERWNGTSWATSPLPAGLTSEISAASAVAPTDIWAVTQSSGDILHWNGTRWAVAYHVSGSGLFTDVIAVNRTDVWVFGFSPAAPGLGTWHFDGTTWTSVTGSGAMLMNGSAVSATDIWAIGDTASGVPAVMHYDGTTWQQVTTAPALTYQSILALSSGSVWATAYGTSGQPLLAHLSGGIWTKMTLPWAGLSPGGPLAPDGSGGFRLQAYDSGSSTWIVHYSASGHWSRTAFAAGNVAALSVIPGTTSVLAGGWVKTSTGASATVWAHGAL